MLSFGKAISGAPICSGMTKLPNAPTPAAPPEEDHDRAVHCPELIVEFGKHDPVGCVRLAEELADQRNRLPGYASCHRMIIISVKPKSRNSRLVIAY